MVDPFFVFAGEVSKEFCLHIVVTMSSRVFQDVKVDAVSDFVLFHHALARMLGITVHVDLLVGKAERRERNERINRKERLGRTLTLPLEGVPTSQTSIVSIAKP